MSNVVIGRKELWSFAERYTGCRVRDVADLADGEVALLLFARIFPCYRLRPASHNTHSVTQRRQFNWESLIRGCVRVRIPLSCVLPAAVGLRRDNAFALLALLYFLFHLSRRVDFSTEFGEDVPEALLAYLQSMDSIATLFLGEALDWSAVPEAVGEQIRSMPAFHTAPEEDQADEEEAIHQYRAATRKKDDDTSLTRSVQPQPQVIPAANRQADTPLPEADNSPLAPPQAPTRRSSLVALSIGEDGAARTPERPPGELAASLERERLLLQQLATKTEECERLQCREVELVDQLSRGPKWRMDDARSPEMYRFLYEMERDRASAFESKLQEVQRQLEAAQLEQRTSIAGSAVHPLDGRIDPRETELLLEDIVDPETGAVVEAHQLANQLHQILSSSVPSQRDRDDGVRAVRLLWGAYSEVERRLVHAVEVMDGAAGEARPRTTGTGAALRAVEELQQMVAAFYAATCRREDQWRSLCSKLYQAEKLTLEIAQATEEGPAGAPLDEMQQRREGCYADIEGLTEALLQLPRSHREEAAQSLHERMNAIEKHIETLHSALLAWRSGLRRERGWKKYGVVPDHRSLPGIRVWRWRWRSHYVVQTTFYQRFPCHFSVFPLFMSSFSFSSLILCLLSDPGGPPLPPPFSEQKHSMRSQRLTTCIRSRVPRVDISGRNKGIKHIDLGRVIPRPDDVRLLRCITHFDLSHNELQVLSHLNPLSGLRMLDVSYNRIAQVLSLPTSLTQLNLSHNRLEHLEGLADLVNLRELDVSHNYLPHLAGLHPRMPLEVLIADDNRIQQTLGLDDLASLRVLSLTNNLIEKPEELYFLSSCPRLEALHLNRNPVAQQKLCRPLVAKLHPGLAALDGAPLARGGTPQGTGRTQVELEALERRARGASRASSATSTVPAGHQGQGQQQAVQPRGPEPAPPRIPVAMPSGSGLWSPRTRAGSTTPPSDGRSPSLVPSDQPPRRVDLRPATPSEEAPAADTHVPKPTLRTAAPLSAPTPAPPRPSRGYAGEFREALTCSAEEAGAGTTSPLLPSEARLATHSATAQLHDAIVGMEQAQKECQLLREKLHRTAEQLQDSRRVVSEQLGRISQLRMERDALKKSAEEAVEASRRLKRTVRAMENHHRDEVRSLQEEKERLKVAYETQLADLRRQLANRRRGSASGCGADVTATSAEEREQLAPQHTPLPVHPQASSSCSSLRTGDTMSSFYPSPVTETDICPADQRTQRRHPRQGLAIAQQVAGVLSRHTDPDTTSPTDCSTSSSSSSSSLTRCASLLRGL
eukprot:gene8606-6042_t